jgi:hypothetical protein
LIFTPLPRLLIPGLHRLANHHRHLHRNPHRSHPGCLAQTSASETSVKTVRTSSNLHSFPPDSPRIILSPFHEQHPPDQQIQLPRYHTSDLQASRFAPRLHIQHSPMERFPVRSGFSAVRWFENRQAVARWRDSSPTWFTRSERWRRM